MPLGANVHRSRRWQWAAIAIGLGGSLLFGVVVDETDLSEEAEGLQRADLRLATWLATHTPPLVFSAGVVAGWIGGGWTSAVIVLVASAASWAIGRRAQALAIAAGAAILQGALTAAKSYFLRPRPEYGVEYLARDGFPSGHAAFAAYLAVILAWLALRHVPAGRVRAMLVGLAAS